MLLEIPADLVDEANEWKEKLVEAVAESNDTLMEKFFEDPEFYYRKRDVRCYSSSNY